MTSALNKKRQDGRYYTEGNPFLLEPFINWADSIDLKKYKILEPFAGANNIIRALHAHDYAEEFSSFDIEPFDKEVIFADTLKDFPKGFDVCITNPPWLAKNSAHRRGLEFPETQYDDLYKHALGLCLENCTYVAALIPATFLQSRLFMERLQSVIFLHDKSMFNDTENPVCLALFKDRSDDVEIFSDAKYIGTLSTLNKFLPTPHEDRKKFIFNDPQGELGFIAFDNTTEPSIRFCSGEELTHYRVGFSSRMITRISGNFGNIKNLSDHLNKKLTEFRNLTEDVFLTPFKGLRKDGRYRRRMDYGLARDFISNYA